MLTGHTINCLPPELSPQTGQRIGEAGPAFVTIPRQPRKLAPKASMVEIPQPYHRVKPEAHGGSPFGPLSFEALRLLATDELLGVFERFFDAPASGVLAHNLSGRQAQVGRHQENIFGFAGRVAADNHPYRLLGYMIPDDLACPDHAFFLLCAFDGSYTFEIPHQCREFPWLGEQLAAYSLASASGLFLRRQRINDSVLSHACYQMHPRQVAIYKGGVEAIAMAYKPAFLQPVGHFGQHTLGEIDMSRALFDAQTHIDRQCDRLAAPRRTHTQRQHNEIEPSGENYQLFRAYGIAPPGGALDLASASVKEGVVEIQMYSSARIELFDQQDYQQPPQLCHRPPGFGEKAVKAVVWLLAKDRSRANHAGDGSSAGAQEPAADQCGEDICRWSGKNREKVLKKLLPSRCYSLYKHTSLQVVSFPIQTSVGWYVCAQLSSSLAA